MSRVMGWFLLTVGGVLAAMVPSATAAAQQGTDATAQRALDTVMVVGAVDIPPRVYKYAYRNGMAASLARAEEELTSELPKALAATGYFQVRPTSASAVGEGGTVYSLMPRFEAFEDLVVGTELPQLQRVVVIRKVSLTTAILVTSESTGQALPLMPSITAVQIDENIYPAGQEPEPDPRVITEAVRETATKLAQALLAQLHPPKILAASEWQVVLNRGSNGGFQVGDRVQFYAVREGDDPASADRATEGTVVGEGVLVRVYGDQSRATIVGENLGIAVGCLARPLPLADAAPVPASAAP